MDDNVLCPVCKAPMLRLGNVGWYCPLQKRAVEQRRPVGRHYSTGAVSVWTEARLDAWHSPA